MRVPRTPVSFLGGLSRGHQSLLGWSFGNFAPMWSLLYVDSTHLFRRSTLFRDNLVKTNELMAPTSPLFMPSTVNHFTTSKTSSQTSSRSGGTGKPTGLQLPCHILEPLSGFIGSNTASRVEINKKIWAYIKENNLQHPDNRRLIVADERLRKVLGRTEVHMFELAKLIAPYIRSQR